MLTLRQEQYQCFAADELSRFKATLSEHLLETFPLQTSMADAEALSAYVDLVIHQARDAGIDTQASVQSFADHMIVLGSGFYENPLYAEITTPLRDPDLISPVQRMDLVYDRAWDYLERTRGRDGKDLVKAMGRLRAMLSLRHERWTDDFDELYANVKRIFPQKAASHDRRTLAAFFKATLERAGMDGFTKRTGRALYVCIAFLTGIGFFHDPLVRAGAAPQAAALERETDPRQRVALLGTGAMAYLDKSLEMLRGTSDTTGG